MNQGPFETTIYDILKVLPLPHPGKENCPAVLAERAGKSAEDIIDTCRACFLKLMEQDKGR